MTSTHRLPNLWVMLLYTLRIGLAVALGLVSTVAAQQPAGAPAQPQAGGAAPTRLGRTYPAPMPPPSEEARDEPDVSVSVVSPQDSGVHRHQRLGRERGPRSGGGGSDLEPDTFGDDAE